MVGGRLRWHRILTAAVVLSVIATGTLALSGQSVGQSIGQTADIALGSGTTTQSMTVDYELPGGTAVDCTVDTEPVTSRGVEVLAASVSAVHEDHSISASVTSTGDVSVSAEDTDDDSEGEQSLEVTVKANTTGVAKPQEDVSYDISCGSQSAYDAGFFVRTSHSGFDIKDTGVQDTGRTAIADADATVESGTPITQTLAIDLIVPDDGDGDGDTYAVTIDTRESRAAGIEIAGASLEADPSGADADVAVVEGPTVAASGNVSLTIREAAGDRADGNISRDAISVSLRLEPGRQTSDLTIAHVVTDAVGTTTASRTFEVVGSTPTPSPTPTPTASPSPTPSPTPTATPSPSPTHSPTASPTPTPTERPTATPSPTDDAEASPTGTAPSDPTETPTESPSQTGPATDGELDTDSETEVVGSHGFSAGSSVVALAIALLVARRRAMSGP